MKHYFSIIVLLCSFFLALQADNFEINAGAGFWQQEVSGSIQYLDADPFDTQILGYVQEEQPYAWFEFSHEVSWLPDLRLEYTDIDFSGTADSGFNFDGKFFPSNTQSLTSLEQFDTILFYTIFEDVISSRLDLGVDIKYMDARFYAQSKILFFTVSTEEKFNLILPLLYANYRIDLPAELGLEFEGRYMGLFDSNIQDYTIKVDYELVRVSDVDIGVEVGYRYEKVVLEQDDFDEIDFDADLEVDGVFAGLFVHF